MMLAVVLFMVGGLGAQAAPTICGGKVCEDQLTRTLIEASTTNRQHEVLLIIGGQDANNSLSRVDVITSDLEVIPGALPNAPYANSWSTLQTGLIDDEVVVCGGTFLASRCNHLNLTTRTWTHSSTMEQNRFFGASVVDENNIYMFSGGLPSRIHVERYNKVLNIWDAIPEWAMPEPDIFICAVHYDNYIYLMGGLPAGRKTARLSTITNTWEVMEPMLESRLGHRCVVANIGNEDGILVTGGTDASNAYLSSTEFFSFSSQEWNKLSDMNAARRDHGLEIINGMPIVFGGEDSSDEPVDSIETYSHGDNRWVTVEGAKLPTMAFAYAKVPLEV